MHAPIAAILALSGTVMAQPPAARFTDWKNHAVAAYAVTMDDFCGVASGIARHADTLFHNRGLVFGFGVIAGACGDGDWEIARRLLAHGHEMENHSWSHGCGARVPWCTDRYWDSAQFALEIDSAARVAERRTGVRMRFFLFPFDVWESQHLDYLRRRQYVGARAGGRRDVNPSGFSDGFGLFFDALHPPGNQAWQAFGLNAFVNTAIRRGGFALRETHGVADGSYAATTVEQLRAHLDYVKSKVEAGLLWVAGPAEIVKYRMGTRAYAPRVAREKDGLTVAWEAPGLDTTLYDAELTLRVTVPAGFRGFSAWQNRRSLPFTRTADTVQVNLRPHRGPLVLAGAPP